MLIELNENTQWEYVDVMRFSWESRQTSTLASRLFAGQLCLQAFLKIYVLHENSCFWILVPVWKKKRMVQKCVSFWGSQLSYLYKPFCVVTLQLSNRLLLLVLEWQKRCSGSEITWFFPFLTKNCYCYVPFMPHSHVILGMNPLYEWFSEKPLRYVKTCLIFCILYSRHITL